MEGQILPEQNQQLRTWAAERDAILLEISNLRTEKDKLVVVNKDLAASNSVLQTSINESTGRVDELLKKEKELGGTVNKELAETLDKKSTTEEQVTGLEKQVALLESQKSSLIETIKILNDSHDRVFERVNVLDKVIDHVVSTNSKTLDEMNYFLKDLVSKKHVLNDVVISLSNNYDRAFGRIEMLDKVVDRLVSVSTKNLSDINTLLNK